MSTPKSENFNELEPSSEHIQTKEQYAQAFKQLDAEARYTFFAALIVTIVFWLAIFLTHDLNVSVFHLPLWFVLSCLGGYVFSVVVVIVLVKWFMKPCPLKVSSLKHGQALIEDNQASRS